MLGPRSASGSTSRAMRSQGRVRPAVPAPAAPVLSVATEIPYNPTPTTDSSRKQHAATGGMVSVHELLRFEPSHSSEAEGAMAWEEAQARWDELERLEKLLHLHMQDLTTSLEPGQQQQQQPQTASAQNTADALSTASIAPALSMTPPPAERRSQQKQTQPKDTASATASMPSRATSEAAGPRVQSNMGSGPSLRGASASLTRRRSRVARTSIRAASTTSTQEPAAIQDQRRGRRSASLLTSTDEVELAAVVKDFLQLQGIEKQLSAILKRRPSMAEWARAAGMDDERLFATRLSTGQQAKATLVTRNMGLVKHLAKKYMGRGSSFEDLAIAGIKGLHTAVEKYDGERGHRFSTYATWWIIQAIRRSVVDQGRIIRLPDHILDTARLVMGVTEVLRDSTGKAPSVEQVSEMARVPKKRVQEVLQYFTQVGSLDAKPGKNGKEDEDDGKLNRLQDENETPDEELEATMLKKDLLDMIKHSCNERQAAVLTMRWFEGKYQSEIAAALGVTQQRVMQVEKEALHKLKIKQSGSMVEHADGDQGQRPRRALARSGKSSARHR